MTVSLDELKAYLTVSLDSINNTLNRLQAQNGQIDSTVRAIELNTTKNIAEIRKDIEELTERLDDIEKFSNLEKLETTMQAADMAIRTQINANEQSQKIRWETLNKERNNEALVLQKYQTDTAAAIKVLSDGYSLITKLLWTIIGVLLAYGIPNLIDWIRLKLVNP